MSGHPSELLLRERRRIAEHKVRTAAARALSEDQLLAATSEPDCDDYVIAEAMRRDAAWTPVGGCLHVPPCDRPRVPVQRPRPTG